MRFYALAQRPWIEEDGGGYWGLPPGTIGSVDLSAVGARNRVFVTSDQPFTVGGGILATFGDGTRLDQFALSGRARNDWNNLLGVSVPNGTILLDALWNILTVHADPTGTTRAKPIMPTRAGVLELHLGGHSLLRSERLPEDPTLHPAWANIQAVKQRTCRALYQRDETLARKWLGNEQRRFRLSAEAATELLVPSDLPRLSPVRPTTTIADNFNRANQSGLGASAEGWSWAEVTGDWSIFSNRARKTGSNAAAGHEARAEIDLSSDDHSVAVDAIFSTTTDTRRAGPCARFAASEQTCYMFQLRAGTGGSEIFRRNDNGTRTYIDDQAFTASTATPYRMVITVDGSTITGTIDGTPQHSVTSTSLPEGVRTGITLSHNNGGTEGDNFEATDLLADVGDDLVRVLAEAVGTLETRARLMAVNRWRFDSVGIGHASLRPRSRSRWLVETYGIGEATVSVVEAIGAELIRVVSEGVTATEAMARALGLVRARNVVLGTTEGAVRLRALARRRSEMTALAETARSAREMVRLRSEAATVSETTARVIDAIIAAVVRVVTEVIAMAEMAGRARHRARSRRETVGLATTIVLVGVVLGAAPAAIADRARMVVRAARRLIDRAAIRFNVPPARR